MSKHTEKAPSNRQLKVGEEIRRCLSDIFIRGEVYSAALRGVSVTVSEVRISPDLKSATAYVMPLSGQKADFVVNELEKIAPFFRSQVSARVNMKFTPRISFRKDESFERIHKIEEILNKPEVKRDIISSDNEK